MSAKSDGVTPGFTIRDTADQLWFVKFDPPGWRAMATGSEIVAAKLFWAAGYHTAEYHIAQLTPANLVDRQGHAHHAAGRDGAAMQQSDIAWLLSRADRDADGSYRVILSKATPGRPVGRIAFHGTRADDPNDIVPHEHRRELRGYFVFAAWLNHVDAKGINSLSSLVTENGRSFIRHYLLDFGSALGSAAVGPREGWEGLRGAGRSSPARSASASLSFGFKIPAVAHAGLLRVAGDRPAAQGPRGLGSRDLVAAHHQRGVPAHARRTTRSGRRRSWPRSPTT